MFKKTAVVILILLAAGLMALVGYSFITTTFLSQKQFLITEGSGMFWERDRPAQGLEVAPALGYLAPDFELLDLNGEMVHLSQFRGRPVLLNFWASTCPSCRTELPDLQRFYEQYKNQVVVLGVNWSEEPRIVRDFLDSSGVSFQNVLDRTGKAFVSYQLTGVPTTFFIDEAGLIRGAWLGPLNSAEIAESFNKITYAFKTE